METKEQLVKTIKEWVKLDNEIRTLHNEEKNRKLEKKKISNSLMEIMKKNEIIKNHEQARNYFQFFITVSNGKLSQNHDQSGYHLGNTGLT